MTPKQRFYTFMSVFFGLMAVVSAVRILTCDGRSIWYVPFVLAAATAVMVLGAVQENRKRKAAKNK